MARIPIGWPPKNGVFYQEIYNECLRVEAMLATCLAEYEEDNPWLFEYLLPRVTMRIRHINQAAVRMKLAAPKGQGRLPKWFHTTERIERISERIGEVLETKEMNRKIREHRFIEVSREAKSIIQASQYIRKLLISVPMENSQIVMTISGFKEVVLK